MSRNGEDMEMSSGYDLKLDEVIQRIKEDRFGRILLQFPEGLKSQAIDICRRIESAAGCEVVISADPCFGACDIPPYLTSFNIDLLVQFGHLDIPDIQIPVPAMFIRATSNLDVLPVVEAALGKLEKRVGLITTAQHVHTLRNIVALLESRGFSVLIGEGSSRIKNRGQVLGCNLSAATSIASEVDCFLFIGSGNFHPLGVAVATDRKVIIADPYENRVRDSGELRDRMLRQRHGAIVKASDAKSFGILVGTKPGQNRINLALTLKTLAQKHQRKAYLILLDNLNPMNMRSFDVDAFVSTACPRIAMDDYATYHVPIITPLEFEIVLGVKKWENYSFDEFH